MKKFLFIDDHAVVRSSFSRILSEPFQPVGVEEAGDGEEAVEKIKKEKFDLVIMDVQMPQTDTLGLVAFITNFSTGTRILMLSMAEENIYARRYIKAGANGFVSKHASLDEVTKAMETVLSGKTYISDMLADKLVKESLQEKTVGNPFENLSRREFEIATHLLQGQSVSEISKLLSVALSTIGTHKSGLFEKLGVFNLIELKDLAAANNM